MVADVRQGLLHSPKQLSPKYFYDERGSELFEEITQLPEYYLNRAERLLLEQCIAEIVRDVHPCSLVELGAGSATKTRIILDEMRANGCAECYVPVDVSKDILEGLNRELGADFPIADFRHRAFYSREQHRVEMHLFTQKALRVNIPEIGEISFEKGESIRTELSYKYDRRILEDILCASGLTIEKWMPADDDSFALALARAEA